MSRVKKVKIVWQEDVSIENIPAKGLVAISIRDNILDDENYPMHGLFLKEGIVEKQFCMDEGKDVAYSLPNMVGKTVGDLVDWVNENRDNDANYFPEIWKVIAILSEGGL
jgi:hypothetical protein